METAVPSRGPEALRRKVVEAFRVSFDRQAEVVVKAPGRVNLLGAHTDYNEGWVMPAAINRAVWLAAAAAPDGRVRLRALDMGEQETLDLADLPSPIRERKQVGPRWVDYPAGVAWAFQHAGHELCGIDAVFRSSVPIGAGVSSSAALEVAFILAWERLSGLQLDGVGKARLGQQTENLYLNIQSGIMDQFASLHGTADHFLFLDCRSLDCEPVPIPSDLRIVVAESGVQRSLAGSKYNDRRRESREATEILRRFLPDTRALRDVTPSQFEHHSHHLPDLLRRRARHVVEECDRVRQGAAALRRGDLETFGALIRQSHVSSRDLYEVSIPQLDTLAAAAWPVPGCYGARLSGGGFGGCVTALVQENATGPTQQAMAEAFREEFGTTPSIFSSTACDGAALYEPD